MEVGRRTALALPWLCAAPAFAQGGRPARLIVPFPAGGTTDLLARLTTDRLAARLGHPVVVENRAGAAGGVAAAEAARGDADGSTLFLASIGTAATNPLVYRHLPYRTEDLAEVAALFALPNVATVAPRAPFPDLAGFIAAAREKPGALSFGSSGAGSSLHLTGEMLKHRAGIDLLHVPYRGGGQMLTELLAGRIDIAFGNLPTAIGMIRDGTLRALAVTGPRRNPALPDIPTVAEAANLSGFAATVWFGLQVPRATPAPVVERLNEAAQAMLAEPAVRARLAELGVEPMGGSPADFSRFVQDEAAAWRPVITGAGISVE
ncbi:Bug family tripartite tricarboxylate transporter substrate binding protein [Sabulicella rubraurantiaca]|uniref:Bug family tripartite tricarboxylate transporter substrate binding protein n=1 Tax=Sabulicella rubraurantiaca TaxID=2811429 RepID=UPI001A95A8C0|nr:tripartite tricarboxylate transporter substrate-binding protein [Sabulicella rubraurantiaca]